MSRLFAPSVTVAAIVCEGGRYLVVEEETALGLRYNQPAGHLEPGESLVTAAIRETLEETAREFRPLGLQGVYLACSPSSTSGALVTYLRFAFVGTVGQARLGAVLDQGIVRTLWLTPAELTALTPQHRSPLVLRCVTDHQAGNQPYPLGLLHTDPSALAGIVDTVAFRSAEV
jgi:8-oxo-dGTP pyrophosphatase MutT (NUDIX family)